jgi:hypothetical protein
MPVDTFVADVGMYPGVGDAEADYQLVKDLHTKAGLIDGCRDRTRRQGRRRRPGVTGS